VHGGENFLEISEILLQSGGRYQNDAAQWVLLAETNQPITKVGDTLRS
jgi:hypothetical protein